MASLVSGGELCGRITAYISLEALNRRAGKGTPRANGLPLAFSVAGYLGLGKTTAPALTVSQLER